jgi:hypothetical protein
VVLALEERDQAIGGFGIARESPAEKGILDVALAGDVWTWDRR